MKHLLIPVDFSGYSVNACRFAIQLASRLGAKVTIFHAYHIPIIDPMIPVEYLNELSEKTKKDTDETMEKLVLQLEEYARMHHIGPVQIAHASVLGLAADEIILSAKKLQCDLIVMGRRLTEGMDKILLGSMISSVIETAKIPVLVIPESVQPEAGLKEIAYASNVDADDKKSLSKLLQTARALNAKVHCLHVNTQHDRENSNAAFMEIKKHYSSETENGHIVFEKIVADDVADALLEYIKLHQIDLLAMLTHQRTFFMKLFDRSLTKKLAHRSNVPLLIYHQADKQ